MGTSDQLLLNTNNIINQLQGQLNEAKDRVMLYKGEICSLVTNLDQAVDSYKKVVKADKQLRVTLQIKTTGNCEKEAPIQAACEAESGKKMQEIESNDAAEQAKIESIKAQ